MANVYIYKEKNKSLALTSPVALEAFDFTVIAPYCGIADEACGAGEEVSIDVREGLIIETDAVADASTFATKQAPVYFNTTTKEFTDVSAAGLYMVGYLTDVKTSAGVIRFEKLKYVTVVAGE